jgi:hypothetical protein
MADIAEECRLRAINLGQRVRPTLGLLEGHGVADRRRNMVGGQLEEILVPIVKRTAGTDPGDQHTVGMIEARPRQRQMERRFIIDHLLRPHWKAPGLALVPEYSLPCSCAIRAQPQTVSIRQVKRVILATCYPSLSLVKFNGTAQPDKPVCAETIKRYHRSTICTIFR